MRLPQASRGFTLIEVVVSVAVMAAASAALLGVMTFVSKDSSEAMVRQQASSIAHAYLAEALARPVGPNAVVEATRQQYDNVLDFNGLNDAGGARDATGAAIPGLQNYAITIQVVNGMLGAGALALPAGTARRVDVTVTHSSGIVSMATGYRTP